MQRAGERVWQAINERWPSVSRLTVFAGAGNNGGDAFVVALRAGAQGVAVQLLVQGDLSRQSATSRHFRDLWEQGGGLCEAWQGQSIDGEVIVDGLLGIGLQRELDAHWQDLVTTINAAPQPCVAIDIPSGLNGLSGVAQPVAVEAQLTVTFIGRKAGQFLADGPDYCGELQFDDLGISSTVRNIGGDQGMSGAVALAAQAALRSGAGLVTALVHPDCRHSLAAFPELMVLGWDALEAKLADANVVVVGPGLGRSVEAQQCLQALHNAEQPMVIDASALDADFLQSLSSQQRVITPHPGEAATLLSTRPAEIQANRLLTCERLFDLFGATTVLKGSGTIIAESAEVLPAINTRGTPGMASAGMGDVLSGIIAALLGQGLAPFAAARSAVYIHALCAELYSLDRDQSGLLASDVIDNIPRVVKQLRDAE